MASVVSLLFSNTNFQNTNKIMKTKELRVGNYIFFSGVETQLIPADFKTQCRGLNGSEMPNIEPIKLTEEILLKFGFELVNKIGAIKRLRKNQLFQIRIIDTEIFYEHKRLDFVHELQNIFFCLCGEDLVFSTEP